MASITISYTAQHGANTAYSITLDQFSGEDVPRSFVGGFSFDNSANGTSILAGPSYQQKRIWSISVPVTQADTQVIYDLFKAWDTDRAEGLPVACGIVDDTFMEEVSANAIFSTPPSFSKLGGYGFLADFAMTEV
jgi:hypothetical protein